MNALVTGGTGFLGRRLAARLRDRGWTVTAAGRNEAVGHALEEEGIRFLRVDLRDEAGMNAACKGQQAVFHCGAMSAAWGPYRDFYEMNVTGTKHVIAGCMRHEVGRLIHVSTPSVYYNGRDRIGVREADPLPPRQIGPYAATKRLAELAVEQACREGLQAVILRPRAIFGPGDTAILPRLIQANRTRGIPLMGGGGALIDLTYVDNVVDALLLCQSAPKAATGRAYNISGGQPLPFREAVRRLFDLLGEPVRGITLPYRAAYGAAAAMELAARLLPGHREPMLTRTVCGMLGRSLTLDIGEAREKLGYAPQVTVEEGMRRFAGHWRGEA